MSGSFHSACEQPGPRVVHVALQLDTGGLERLLVEFARHRGGHEPVFVSLTTRGPVANELEARGCRVICLGMRPGLRPRAIADLRRLFGDLGADIVHTHNTKPLLYAGPAARLAGIAAVVHTRHGQRFGATGVQHALFRMAARCADRVVCVSEDSAARSIAEGVRRSRVCVVRNGIDVERFEFRGPRPDGPIVFVGRISPEKDVVTLLRAAALLRGPTADRSLVIAGDGPAADEARRIAASLGIDARTRFLGEVTDVAGLLRTASMFVLPSLSEGLSVTLLEAMATGLPVVATRVGGTPEVVRHGENGLLVESGDAASLARAIERLADEPEMACALGRTARQRVEREYDVRVMVCAYERLYAGILRRVAA
jgi:glycosyltransferase involved in cell wall biosynthesis